MFKLFWSLLTVIIISSVLSACVSVKPDAPTLEVKKSDPTSSTVPQASQEQSTDADIAEPIPEVTRPIVIQTSDGREIVIAAPSGNDDSSDSTSTEHNQQDKKIVEFDGEGRLLEKLAVYFDFDSSDISDSDLQIIEAHARLLADQGDSLDLILILQGHADERGSREYNIALGERRAGGVGQLMELLGVPDNRLRIISYGEERPIALGHNETAWKINRRANLLYRESP